MSYMLTVGIFCIALIAALVIPNYLRTMNKAHEKTASEKHIEDKQQKAAEQISPERLSVIENYADRIITNETVSIFVARCGTFGCPEHRSMVAFVPSDLLFPDNPITITPKYWNELSLISEIALDFNAQLTIIGNSNEDLLQSTEYRSTWELSALRAAKVAELFINRSEVDPLKIVVQGAGHYTPTCDVSFDDSRECHNENNRVYINIDHSMDTSPTEWDTLIQLVEDKEIKQLEEEIEANHNK